MRAKAAEQKPETGSAAAGDAVGVGVVCGDASRVNCERVEWSARAVTKLSGPTELSARGDRKEVAGLEERLRGGDSSSRVSTGPGWGGTKGRAPADEAGAEVAVAGARAAGVLEL